MVGAGGTGLFVCQFGLVVDGTDIKPKMRSIQEQVTDDKMKDIDKEEQENVEQCVLRKIMLLPKRE